MAPAVSSSRKHTSTGIGALTEPLDAVTEGSSDEAFGINVRGRLFAVHTAVPLMTGGGSITINGSLALVKGIPARDRVVDLDRRREQRR